jgi:two-component system, chemotaxis family, protein-glutamate methylesterase/glutaminase
VLNQRPAEVPITNDPGEPGHPPVMTAKLLVIGASAGGVQATERLVADLPADLGAAVLVTVHIPAWTHSSLPGILDRAGPLAASPAVEGMPVRPNEILVAPPGRHLMVSGGLVRLGAGPKINRQRPAVDVMFASAARWAGPDVVAVVLSGAMDDGAVGAALVARAGGRVFVQDPAEAQFKGMPRAALTAAPEATPAPVGELGALVTAAIRTRSALGTHPPREEVAMGDMADSDDVFFLTGMESHLTRLVCPDCGGSLAQVVLPSVSWYRCHVGHQWSPGNLAAAQAETSEDKIWSAVAALEEEAALNRHLAAGDRTVDHLRVAERASELAKLLRAHLEEL